MSHVPKRDPDFYSKAKWHIFQTVLLVLFIILLYKVVKAELPSIPWPF